jgi:putative DNA primase/helicase
MIDGVIMKNFNDKISAETILRCCSSGQKGDAELFVAINKNRFIYDHSARRWYIFGKHYWERDKTNHALDAVCKVADLYDSEADRYKKLINETDEEKAGYLKNVRKEFLKKLKQIRNKRWKEDVLVLAASGENGLGITGDEWDQEPFLLAAANGIIDITTGKLILGRPDLYIKTATPIQYVENAQEPENFINFLNEVFARDQEIIKYVHRLLGYSLLGKVREHIFIILVGEGRNGKGTLLETIKYVLGPYAGAVKSSLLLAQDKSKSSSSPNPDILDLRGKRFVWAAETNKDKKIDPGMVKWLTGGDTLVGRHVYGRDEVRFDPSHTLFLMTNHKPKIPYSESDLALWERMQVLTFTESFIDEPREKNHHKVDKDLPEKLKKEDEGILAWLVRGYLAYQREGLNPPQKIKDAVNDYRKEEDVLPRFISECCVVDTNARVGAEELYILYCEWSTCSDCVAMSQTKFGEIMNKMNFDKIRSNGIRYLGIRLRNENDIRPSTSTPCIAEK